MSFHPAFPGFDFPEVGDRFTQTPHDGSDRRYFGNHQGFDNLEVTSVTDAVGHLFIRYICRDEKRNNVAYGYATEREWVGHCKRFDRKKV